MAQKEIGFALIGCGRIATRHADAIAGVKGAKVVGVCDMQEDRRQELASLTGAPSFSNYHQMMESLKAQVDVVSVLTPSGIHFEHVVDLLQYRPRAILVEKPMTMTLEQAVEINNLTKAAKIHLFPVFQNRFNKAVQRVRTAMQEGGDLGALRVGTVRMRWCRPQRYYDLAQWRGTWAMDGGAMTNQGIHYLDLLRYICGEVEWVFCKTAQLGARLEAEDTAVATLGFRSGALGVVEIMTSARPDDFEASISCVCEKGLGVIAGIATNTLTTFSPDEREEALHSEEFPTIYGFGHDVVVERIVKTLQGIGSSPVEVEDAIQTLNLLHALYRSDETGAPVELSRLASSSRLGKTSDPLLDPYRTPRERHADL